MDFDLLEQVEDGQRSLGSLGPAVFSLSVATNLLFIVTLKALPSVSAGFSSSVSIGKDVSEC